MSRGTVEEDRSVSKLQAAVDLVAEAYEAIALADQRAADADAENQRLRDICKRQLLEAEATERELQLLRASALKEIEAAEARAAVLAKCLHDLCERCDGLRQAL